MTERVFVDTNTLLDYAKEIFEKYDNVKICDVVLEEIDKLKHFDSNEVQYKARVATREIKNHEDIIDYIMSDGENYLPNNFNSDSNDDRIINLAKKEFDNDNNLLFLTNDLNMEQKLNCLNINVSDFEANNNQQKYNGWTILELDEEGLAKYYESNIINIDEDLYNNQYVLIKDKSSDQVVAIEMWNGEKFEKIKIKPISNKYESKIKALDDYQKIFIHMLQNKNTKIKITDSPYGAGKSYLMIHWALQMIEKGEYEKLLFVKSDSPPKNRKEFPAIPGDINEKLEPLAGVLCDIVGEDNLTEILLRNSELEMVPIQFVKGRSLRNSILYVNECQDFTPSEMERLLSRIGENTVAILDGSTNQTDNKNCFGRNGLTVASENLKDEKNVSQVNLIENYRSEVSKMIANKNWCD